MVIKHFLFIDHSEKEMFQICVCCQDFTLFHPTPDSTILFTKSRYMDHIIKEE
jgi:hypothetical protein